MISLGIKAVDVKKLQDAGIYTCNGLMMHTKKILTGIKGMSEAKVDKIYAAAEKLLSQGFMTGTDLLIKRKSVVRITTGSQALDELLGGGIETLCITEAFGEFPSGKTQLAHTLCVSTQLPRHMHGANGKVAYIDTDGTFRPERIVPIAERFGMDANGVLDNIIYARAYTYEHQYNLLLDLAAKMAEEPFRLLIVDSVIALSRVDSSGWGELAERQQKLPQMLSLLKEIAEEFNVAVYITHQGVPVFTTDPKKPAGGHVLAHTATIRLMLRKGKGKQRVCKIFDAPNLPEGEAVFQITTGGLMDVKGSSKGLTYFSKLLAGANKSSPSPTWPWVSCRSPRTTSFREDDRRWPCTTTTMVVSRNPSAEGSCYDDSDDWEGNETASEELLEAEVHSLSLTDPCSGSNSIMAVTSEERAPLSLMEGSVAEVVYSEDPYEDFRASMERMVAAHGVCGRKAQEELLVWYLRLNERHNHALIVRSFFDILVALPTCNNGG